MLDILRWIVTFYWRHLDIFLNQLDLMLPLSSNVFIIELGHFCADNELSAKNVRGNFFLSKIKIQMNTILVTKFSILCLINYWLSKFYI